MQYAKTKQTGFSFLEMSIVLVIIGLLMGAVMVGLNLKRAAEVRALTSEMDRLIQAVTLFKQKYNQLPGDMYNAASFWGADAACTATPSNTNNKLLTCNGNGNGRIGYVSAASAVDASAYEMFRAWQHLAAGGFIAQPFSGTTGAGGAVDERPGIHNYASDLLGVGWSIGYLDAMAGSAEFYPAVYGNRLAFGRRIQGGGGAPSWLREPVLSTEEALMVDSKIDDGKPGQGKVLAYKPATINPNCATTTAPETALYNAAFDGENACSLLVITGF